MNASENKEKAGNRYLLSLIFVIRPSIVVTTPPSVPLASSNSISGIITLAVSDCQSTFRVKDDGMNHRKCIY